MSDEQQVGEAPDDYLWDKTGKPDPKVQRLEQLLAPFAYDGRPLRAAARRWVFWVTGLTAAVAAIAWIDVFFSPRAVALIKQSDGVQLHRNSVIRTGDDQEVLRLEDLGVITVEPNSVLHVKRLKRDRTRLHLDRGRLHALVYLNARPRFFEVGTPATTCVDLGCQYTLAVNDEGDAHVHVRTGRVAFEDHGREIYVPSGAECFATKAQGAGMPRYTNTQPELRALIDKFDKTPFDATQVAKLQLRLKLVRQILQLIEDLDEHRYTLIVWHLLQDQAVQVVNMAARWLVQRYSTDMPAGFVVKAGARLAPGDLVSWRDELEAYWW